MISILIVDDNSHKIAAIKEVLLEFIEIPKSNILISVDTNSARLHVEKNKFDLLILDLVLPNEFGDKESPENGIYGPGHNGFTVSPDGTEDWIIYHGMLTPNLGGKRMLFMQKFTWNEDGTPNFGVPSGRYTPLKKPSGE